MAAQEHRGMGATAAILKRKYNCYITMVVPCVDRAVVVRNEQSDVDIDHTLLGKQAEDLLNILKVCSSPNSVNPNL